MEDGQHERHGGAATVSPPIAGARAYGELLRTYRERENLRQHVLAARIKIDPTTLSKIECGRYKPPVSATFYEGLREALTLDDSEILLLLHLAGAAAPAIEQAMQARTVISPAPGVSIPIFAPADVIPDADLPNLTQRLKWAYEEFEQWRARRTEI